MQSKYVRIKNELPELLEAVCYHPDCEGWLRDAIWNAMSEKDQAVVFTASHWRADMEAIEAFREDEDRQRAAAEISVEEGAIDNDDQDKDQDITGHWPNLLR